MKNDKTPKDIHYEENGGEIRMYKVWSRKVTSKQPFVITDDIEDFVQQMASYSRRWNIQPKMKEIFKFVTNYTNKYNTENGKQ